MARILALTNMYPPHHLGGYELECRDILDRFRGRGHECLLLTSDVRVPGVADPVGEEAAGTRRTLRIYWEDHRLLVPSLRERWRMERHNQAALRQALAELRPDVVSVWHMGAMSLGLLTTVVESGIPIVYVICDDWLAYAGRHDRWSRMFRHVPTSVSAAVAAVVRVPCRVPELAGTGTFCFVSERTRRVVGGTARFPDSTVVYSGIDTTDFPVTTGTERPWRGRLLCVGRVNTTKGVDTALRALAALPDATLHVVGRGDAADVDALHRLAAELGVEGRVRWSVADRRDLAAIYADADAFLFPVRWDEPFGLVPIEAMACGTPVIATGTGGSGEFLVDGWNCLRFEPDDHEALAAAVRRLGADPSLRDRLTEGGAATARELTIDRLADVLEEWHLAAAARFATGRPAERTPVASLLGVPPGERPRP
jgi:glycogen(starch) synthase